MPGAPREGHARYRPRTRGSPSLERSGPQPALPRKRGAMVKALVWWVAARRPPARQRGGAANATGIGWCRRVAGRKPHSRARNERSQGVPARRFRLQKSASGAWVQRSASPVGSGARGRGPQLPAASRKGSGGGERGGDSWDHGGQAVTPGKSGAGRSRGRCGATELARWKASRIVFRPASVTRASWKRSRRPCRGIALREQRGPREGGDRDARGSDRTRRGGKRTPIPTKITCGPPKRIALT
jgi:hypothetical protein